VNRTFMRIPAIMFRRNCHDPLLTVSSDDPFAASKRYRF